MTYAQLSGGGRRALLNEQLAQAHVGVAAAGPDGVFVAIPASWPIAGAQRLQGRWLLDLLDTPSQAAVIRAWKTIPADRVATLDVVVRGGQHATAWLIYMMDVDGVNAALLVTQESLAAKPREEPSHAPPPQVAIVRRDVSGQVIAFDDRAAALLGWSPDALDARRSLGMHRDDHDTALANWLNVLADPDGIYRYRARLRRQDGQYRWFDITERRRTDEVGAAYVEDELVDVDSEVAALNTVREREAQLHQLMEAVPVGIGHLTADGVSYANDMIHQMMSADPDDDVTALSALRPGDRDRLRAAVRAVMHDGEGRDLTVRRHETGSAGRIFDVVLRPLDPSDIAIGVIACATDVTESRRLRRALERQVNVDHLTGVATRSHILTILNDRLADPRRGALGVLFVDLDGFKAVNDRLGHAAGDMILRTAAQRISGVLRGADAVGRLGGDEFLLVCPHLKEPWEIKSIAQRVTTILAQPIRVAEEDIILSASIGIACVDHDASDAEVLVARADAQMYEAKALGGGRARAAS